MDVGYANTTTLHRFIAICDFGGCHVVTRFPRPPYLPRAELSKTY
ncbi:Uncharacterised protein [Vibrio cholerae]|nr:Uncharacterised protein [Vibrio cholerae]